MKRSPLATLLLSLVTLLVFILLYGPIFIPIVTSFFTVKYGSVDWSQMNLDAYAKLTGNEGVIEAVENTFIVGLSAVAASLVLGTVIALHCNSGKSRSRALLQFVVFLPFLMPPIITGLSLLIFFREVSIDRSMLTIIIGHTVFVLALVYRTILVRLQGIGFSMIEASYDLGASAPQTFFYVLLPNLKSALIGAGVLAFALSFDETMITILVTGTQNTLPLRLWAMMRLGFTPDINALVAIILALTTVMVLIAARYLIPKDFAGADA
ncbi:ABC transporter permease [Dongia sedimenti]|uniref:ABC transporter permease n=1 Tax=Dongia sedimenti TaxID=3064282 RepID=A0ABU0YKQ1_9PROT|nr:ABC transporter permease [Rhodospirillaceae bacterium R-7]